MLPAGKALRDAALAACADSRPGSSDLENIWSALVDGRYRFVECFDCEGWRYFLLRENLDSAGHVARLTLRERSLVEAVGRGQSEKAAAFTLGVTPSAASGLLKSALVKMGLRSKIDLVVLVSAMKRSAEATPRVRMSTLPAA
jgi:DNA-binding NarL/FixJ family response regulator